jgi:hypothetical protein
LGTGNKNFRIFITWNSSSNEVAQGFGRRLVKSTNPKKACSFKKDGADVSKD